MADLDYKCQSGEDDQGGTQPPPKDPVAPDEEDDQGGTQPPPK